MRKSVRDFVKIIAETISLSGPIWEFGSYQVKGQESIADLRIFFPNKKYVGCDIRNGRGVDFIYDMQKTNLPDGCIGTVLALDTLEHVENPISACNEISRILNPTNGVFIVSTVMNFSIHDHPADYWRFTPECLMMLMKGFPIKKVLTLGVKENPHTVVGIGFKNPLIDILTIKPVLKEWINRWQK